MILIATALALATMVCISFIASYRHTQSREHWSKFADLLIIITVIIRRANVHYRDTKIEVLVKRSKPFNGRVYALGRMPHVD